MKRSIKITALVYITLSLLSLCYVSVLAWINPREVMSLVDVSLPNPDSIISIRGVYGGVGLTLMIIFIYFIWMRLHTAVLFLTLFWGFYTLSRVITVWVDGPLGEFGNNWMRVESTFCITGLVLLLLCYVRRPA